MGTEPTPYSGVALFVASDHAATIEVKVSSDTVWLTVDQMSALFARDPSVIRGHVRNVFRQGELPDEENYRQNLPVIGAGRPEPAYSLDVIISVGYRVKSQRGIEFRQWATRILKDKLINDYRKSSEYAKKYLAGFKNISRLVHITTSEDVRELHSLLGLIDKYARSWSLLLQYDEKRSPVAAPFPPSPSRRMARLTYSQAAKVIAQFKKALAQKGEATHLFGGERGDGLSSLLRNIEQTWGGQPVYPTVELRAAHLLYFVIKNHPFLDGNKRIGSLLFLHYLSKNGRPLFGENALVALALLIAESDPSHKEFVIRLVVDLTEEAAGAGALHGDNHL
jgi:prophage maintenance system killer protein